MSSTSTPDAGYRRTIAACYLTSASTAATQNLSALLFLTFRSMYGISFSKLGMLILVYFGTQILVDLTFSFFSDRFSLSASMKATPVFITVGLILFSAAPLIFPSAVYVGLVLGTVCFSVGSGLSEVLASPITEAIPSKNPQKVLSGLHACYAWGVVVTVLLATAFIFAFGAENWQVMMLLFALPPLAASLLFIGAPIPYLETTSGAAGALRLFRNPDTALCMLCIFLGGAAECSMSSWCSSYLEAAVGIPKVWGDIFGVALFGVMLGLGRTLYTKFGGSIGRVLILCASSASVCYLVAVFARVPLVGLAACALTGLATSMLWPGSLILSAERVPEGGVAMYALMAAGGDSGASLVPQLIGIVTDAVIASAAGAEYAARFSLSAEQFGMKCGLAVAALFPTLAVVMFIVEVSRGKRAKAAHNS